MVLALEDDNPGGDAVISQGTIHLETLGQWRAVVFIAMDKECWRTHLVGIGQRRLLPKQIGIMPDVGAGIAVDKAITNVTDGTERDPVGDTSLGSCRTKSVGVADYPIGHNAAIGATCYAKTLRVDEIRLLDGGIHERHEVVVVWTSESAFQVGKCIAIGTAAVGIGKDDSITLGSPILHLMEKAETIGSSWPTMDIKYRRILLARLITNGRQGKTT